MSGPSDHPWQPDNPRSPEAESAAALWAIAAELREMNESD